MHGTNEARHRDMSGYYQVREVFETIQGEGPYTGTPAVFVRLTGCNLRCWFCDTEWNDADDKWYQPAELLELIENVISETTHLIVFTGGEPLRQELKPIFDLLLNPDRGLLIQVETAGSFWQECLDHPDVMVVVSPKIATVNKDIAAKAACWKYIVSAGEGVDQLDGLPNAHTQVGPDGNSVGGPPQRHPLNRTGEIWVQPMDEGDEQKNHLNQDLCVAMALKHGYRIGLQTHKILGVE